MDVNRVLFVNQEIAPYLQESALSKAGQQLPQGVQEKGFEVRTFMPKYGCINERRNQLHEVIRLSGMNLIIDDTDHPLIIKVATLQPSRMQVYFIYNDDFFQHNGGKDLETNLSPVDNDERSMFFVRGTMETVKKLRWDPNIIHCQGWISALMPLYLKHVYNEDPAFRGAKIVYSIFEEKFDEPFDARFADKLIMDGIAEADVADIKGKAIDHVALTKLAIAASDGIMQASEYIDPEILKFIQESGKPFLPYTDEAGYIDSCTEFYQSL